MKLLKDRFIGLSATLFVGVVALGYPEIAKSKFNAELSLRSTVSVITVSQVDIQSREIESTNFSLKSSEDVVPQDLNPTDSVVGLLDGVTDSVKSAINIAIEGWNSLKLEIPEFNFGPINFGGFTLALPAIQPLASNFFAFHPET